MWHKTRFNPLYFCELITFLYCQIQDDVSISLEVWNSVTIRKECWLISVNILEQLFFLLQIFFELAFLEGFWLVGCFFFRFIFSQFLFIYHNFIRVLLCMTGTIIVLFFMLWIPATYLPLSLSPTFQAASLANFIQKVTQRNYHGYVKFLKQNTESSLLPFLFLFLFLHGKKAFFF